MPFAKEFLALFGSRCQRLGLALAAIAALDLLVNLALFAASPGLFLAAPPEPAGLAAPPASARSPIRTPYLPLDPTHTAAALAAAPTAASPTAPAPPTEFYGIDFGDHSARIKIYIYPQTEAVNRGKPIVIAVNPGIPCRYQDHRACVNAYRTGAGINVIYISVHSGVGGEAEAYRRAVEGSGVNRAAFSLKLIRSNLARLEGAPVKIAQGDVVIDGLALAAARVPPTRVKAYFDGSVEQALAFAARVDPDLETYLEPDSPVLVFETCGWKLPGEPWAPGVTSTSGSVYIGVIQLAP
jgi:hypothetical protein